MSWYAAYNIILDSLKDSLLIFTFVFLIHVLLSFCEKSLASFLIRRKKVAPIFGSLFGIIPQCGTSVMGADLYVKRYISIGTLIAIFLSCSDEAVISILSSGKFDKMIMVLPLIAVKFVIGFVVGFLADLVFKKQQVEAPEDYQEDATCHTHNTHNSDAHKHLVHPLLHALEIFGYVLAVNLALGFLIGFIGEDSFSHFLQMNKYLSPLFASVIGLIPNCASSLLLAELFIEGNLSFGAILAGLLVNAGLGMTILLKNKNSARNSIWIILICFTVAVAVGYITCLILGF